MRRLVAALGLLALLGLLVAGGALALRATPAERARHLAQLGRERLLAGDTGAAEAFLRRALSEIPYDAEVRSTLVECLFAEGRDDDGDRELEDLLADRPDDGEALLLRGRRRLARGDLDGAELDLDGAAARVAQRVDALTLRARVHLVRGHLEAALTDLVAVARERPEDARVSLAAARALRLIDRLSLSRGTSEGAGDGRAAALLDVAATWLGRRIDPGVAPLAAAVALERGARSSAAEWLDRIDEARRPPLLAARVLSARGEHDAAEALLRGALSQAPSGESRAGRAAALVTTLLGAGHVEDALRELSSFAERCPGDVRLPLVERQCALALRRLRAPRDLLAAALGAEAGVDDAEQAHLLAPLLRADDPDVEAHRVRAGWWGALLLAAERGVTESEHAGRPAAAAPESRLQAEIDALREVDPRDPVAALWSAAAALRRIEDARSDDSASDVARAETGAESAVAGRPGDPLALLVRSLARAAAGRHAAALGDARLAFEARPGDPVVAALLVRGLSVNGLQPEALLLARRVRADHPTDPHLAAALLDALSRAGASAGDGEVAALEAELELARGVVPGLSASAACAQWGGPPAPRSFVARAFDAEAARAAAEESAAPDRPRPALARARDLVLAGRPRTAEDVLRDARQRQDSPVASAALSRLFGAQSRHDDALAELAAAAERFPDAISMRFERARALSLSGRARAADDELRTLLAEPAPRGATPRAQRCAALALLVMSGDREADVERVRRWMRRVAPTRLDGPSKIAGGERGAEDDEWTILRGHLAACSGRFEEGRDCAERVLAGDAESPDGLLLRAVCASGAGRLEQARADLETLLAAPARAGLYGTATRAARRLLARVQFARAESALERGATDVAIDALVRTIGLADLDTRAALALARALAPGAAPESIDTHLGGRVAAVAAEIERLHPRSCAAPLLLAMAASARGDTLAAVAHLRDAGRREPADPVVLTLQIDTLLGRADVDGARAVCDDAVAAGDPTGAAHHLLGVVLERAGERNLALCAYRESLQRHHGNWASLERLVGLLAAAGRVEEARTELHRHADTGAPPPRAALSYARALSAVGESDAAAGVLRTVRPGAAAGCTRLELARACGDAGLIDEARAQLLAAVDETPADAAVYFELAALARRTGTLATCRARLVRWAADGAGAGPANCVLGALEEADGRLEEAGQRYRAALGCPVVRPIAANNLAWLLGVRLGRVAEALPVARAAAEASPFDAEIADTLGRLLELAGEHAEAAELLDRAVALDPSRASFRMHRAETAVRLSRLDAALADYDRALELDPVLAVRGGVRERRAELEERLRHGPGAGDPPEGDGERSGE